MSAFADHDSEIYPDEEVPVLPVPTGGEDWDGASNAKNEANEAKASSNYDLAVEKFTKAMELGGASAMTLAGRAECLLKLRRPLAALSDCDEALKMNPDSAKALRCRGTVCRHMGRWEEANKNISAAQAVDFQPELEELRVFVNAKAVAIEAEKVKQRIADEDALREKVKRQREEIAKAKKEQEEREKAEAEESASQEGFPGGFPGGMPGGFPGGMPGGFPGGMPGMGGGAGGGMQQILMQMLMSDPELAAGLQNPKIINAFTSMMGGGSSPPDLSDPEVAAFMTKLQEKLGPLMGMMGGMGGGMPGGMGGFGADAMGEDVGDDSDDGMPDLEEQDAPRPQVEEVD